MVKGALFELQWIASVWKGRVQCYTEFPLWFFFVFETAILSVIVMEDKGNKHKETSTLLVLILWFFFEVIEMGQFLCSRMLYLLCIGWNGAVSPSNRQIKAN